MNKLFVVSIFMFGCATVEPSRNDFYHRLTLKPTITEKIVSEDTKSETVLNPFDVPIKIVVSCDDETDDRVINLQPNKDTAFTIEEDDEVQSCTIEHWETK